MNIKTIHITKRKRYLLASAVFLALAIIFPKAVNLYHGWAIGGYIIVSYLISVLTLKEDLENVEYVTLFVLPVTFFVGFCLFMNSFIPDRKIFQIPLYTALSIMMYTIFLTENIFNVSAIRTIQLLRFARVICYLLTLVTYLFISSYLISLKLPIIINVTILLFTSALLTFQFLWSYELTPKITQRTVTYTVCISLIVTQIITILNFINLSSIFAGLLMTSSYYVILGLVHHYYEKKLSKRITIEYTVVAAIVYLFIFLSIFLKNANGITF